MSEVIWLKGFSILLILVITLLAGSYPFLRRIKTDKAVDFPIGEALASGVFLGAALLHMLRDSSQAFVTQGVHYPLAFLLAGITFLALLWLEHVVRELDERKGATASSFAILAVFMLSVHSFLVGAALGLTETLSIFFVILLAILAHKWAASFALAVQINKSMLATKARIGLFGLFALMAPLGIMLGTLVTEHLQKAPLLEPVFAALAAGTFLYLGTLHGLRRAVMVEKCCDLRHFSFVIIGFAYDPHMFLHQKSHQKRIPP